MSRLLRNYIELKVKENELVDVMLHCFHNALGENHLPFVEPWIIHYYVMEKLCVTQTL